MQITRHLVVTGRVQRVGFRHAMTQRAEALGVGGWVRNRADGTVEAIVQGDADAVAAMIAWARRGPPNARVEGLSIEPAEGEFAGFRARETE